MLIRSTLSIGISEHVLSSLSMGRIEHQPSTVLVLYAAINSVSISIQIRVWTQLRLDRLGIARRFSHTQMHLTTRQMQTDSSTK